MSKDGVTVKSVVEQRDKAVLATFGELLLVFG